MLDHAAVLSSAHSAMLFAKFIMQSDLLGTSPQDVLPASTQATLYTYPGLVTLPRAMAFRSPVV